MESRTGEIGVHPAAELFPMMTDGAYADFVEDIRAHGLQEPIAVTPDGRILDGRNRHRACLAVGVEPRFVTITSEPYRYVLTENLYRRHLSDAERAMVAAKLADRPRGGWDHVNLPLSKVAAATLEGETPPPELPPTRDEASEILNVKHGSVVRARTVQTHGTADLIELAATGAVPLATAARVAKEPTEKQDAFVADVKAGVNPRKIAPLSKKPAKPPAPEGGGRQKTSTYYGNRNTFTLSALNNLRDNLDALAIGLGSITNLDPAIGTEDATRALNDISRGIGGLSNLRKLLKGRTP